MAAAAVCFSRSRAKTLTPVPHAQRTIDVACAWLNISAIDSVNQTFGADISIRLIWEEKLSDELVQAFPKQLAALHGGPASADLKVFCEQVWDPQFQFPNCQDIDGFEQWLRLERHETHAKCVWAVRFHCNVFTCQFDLRQFPFDQQQLFLRISSGWDETKVKFVMAKHDACRSSFDDYNLPDYFLTGNRIVDVHSTHPRDAPFLCRTDKSSSNSASRYNSIFLIQNVSRQPGYYILNLYVPAFLIASSGLISFVFNVEDFPDRSNVLMTLLLTVVAFRQVITQNLPRLPYLTYMDRYALVSLFLLVAIGVVSSALSTAAICVSEPMRRPTLCTAVLPSLDYRSLDYADYVSLVVIAVVWMVYQGIELFLICRARRIEEREADAAQKEADAERHAHHKNLPKSTEMTEVKTSSPAPSSTGTSSTSSTPAGDYVPVP